MFKLVPHYFLTIGDKVIKLTNRVTNFLDWQLLHHGYDLSDPLLLFQFNVSEMFVCQLPIVRRSIIMRKSYVFIDKIIWMTHKGFQQYTFHGLSYFYQKHFLISSVLWSLISFYHFLYISAKPNISLFVFFFR